MLGDEGQGVLHRGLPALHGLPGQAVDQVQRQVGELGLPGRLHRLVGLLGLILYAAQMPIPEVIDTPLTYLADVTTPLSMLIIGMNLTGGSVSALLRNRDVLSSAFLRLLFLPLLTWWILMLLPVEDPLVIGVTLIIMAMPSPAVTSILAETYGGDTQFASEAVFLSSLLCLVTIPLISLLL